jgi:hypothetical protein
VAEAALAVARTPREPPMPVGWQSIPDLVPVIRARTGAAPFCQALILRWLLDHGAAEGTVDAPPIAAVARVIGISRQSANQAWRALQRRGLVRLTPIDDDRGWSRVTIKLPEARQLSLFAAPDRE